MSGIILSAAVRQNLLSLQDTATLTASTQQRLATGRKVNSALDNPSAFFTSQALSSRAGDLQHVLDQIGQAVQTINAANNGITSITQLVQSAKSLAQQASASTAAVSTYSSVDTSSNILGAGNLNGTETAATFTGTANIQPQPIALTGATATETLGQNQSTATIAPVAVDISTTAQAETLGAFTSSTDISAGSGVGANTISVTVQDHGNTYTLSTATLGANENQAALLAHLQTAHDGSGHTLSQFVNVASANSGTNISFSAISAATDVTITASADTAAAGLTTSNAANRTINSTSLFDNIGGSSTLTINANGNSNAISIDNTHIATLAELNTALQTSVGSGKLTSASASGTTFHLVDAAGATNSVSVTVSGGAAAGLKTALGLGATQTAVDLTNGTGRGGLGTGTTRTFNSAPTLQELDPTNLSGATSTLDLVVNKNDGTAASTVHVTLNNTDNLTAIAADINGTSGLGATGSVTASIVGNKLTLTANNSNVDFTAKASNASTALGLTVDNATDKTTNSTSLYDLINAQSGAGTAQGQTLVVSGTNASGTAFAHTLTFGTSGGGQISSLSQLNSALAGAGGTDFSANATATTSGLHVTGAINITQTAGSKAVLTVGGTVNTLAATAGVLETAPGDVFGTHNSQPTLADINSNQASGGSLNFTVNGKAFTVGLASTDRIDDIVTKLNSSAVGAQVTFTKVTDNSGNDNIKLDGKDASVAVTINANNTSAALGLTTSNAASRTPTQTDLLSLLTAKLGGGNAGQGATLTVQVSGGATQSITFGTGTNQIQTVAQLNTALSALSGVTASVTNAGALDINVASGSQATSLTLGGTAATALGVTSGTQSGTVLSTTANAARTSLQAQYNNVLAQIDTLAKDSSFNGTNLLAGDNLTVSFNEDGSSSQTITGSTVSSANLGLNKLNGTQFQDNTQLTAIVSQADSAVTTLQTTGSQLGSALTTVQARQSFTTAMINTLQTGSDNLVLADINQEGANMLALQTRQQLSTTALSLANQANQAVLRLFG